MSSRHSSDRVAVVQIDSAEVCCHSGASHKDLRIANHLRHGVGYECVGCSDVRIARIVHEDALRVEIKVSFCFSFGTSYLLLVETARGCHFPFWTYLKSIGGG